MIEIKALNAVAAQDGLSQGGTNHGKTPNASDRHR
jgi:hypothetical protein